MRPDEEKAARFLGGHLPEGWRHLFVDDAGQPAPPLARAPAMLDLCSMRTRGAAARRAQGRATPALAVIGIAVVAVAGAVSAQELPPRCGGLARPDRRGRFVAREDMLRPGPPLDGDELLALVNRTPAGALPPGYAPSDLVDLATMRLARRWRYVPAGTQCLRLEAARAYRALEAAMRAAGHAPHVSSAFRPFHVQCATFERWAARERGGFCAAATASALPRHSHHQLGTAVDLFTRERLERDRLREGFGCTPAGRWIAAHAHEHGFVLPYPLHPDYRRAGSDCAAVEGGEAPIDPRTGYRYEPWHPDT